MEIKSAKRSYLPTAVWGLFTLLGIFQFFIHKKGGLGLIFWTTVLLISIHRRYSSKAYVSEDSININNESTLFTNILNIKLSTGFIVARVLGLRKIIIELKNKKELKLFGIDHNDADYILNQFEKSKGSFKDSNEKASLSKLSSSNKVSSTYFQFPLESPLGLTELSEIENFLNKISLTLPCLRYLGTFAEDIQVVNNMGLKIEIDTVAIARTKFSEEVPGKKLNLAGKEFKDLFQLDYNLPGNEKKLLKDHYISKVIFGSTIATHQCPPKIKCPSCSGNGKCQDCGGNGSKTCTSCKGSKTQKVSDGRFKNGNVKYKTINCSNCDGIGRSCCIGCNGSGNCRKCDGHCTIDCSRCLATGYYQTFSGYNESFCFKNTTHHISKDSSLDKHLALTKNATIFSDDVVEWKNESSIIFDRREKLIDKNNLYETVFSNIEKTLAINSNERLGRISFITEEVPITHIKYSFESKPYELKIIGENNVVIFDKIPKKHSFSLGYLDRIKTFLFKKDHQLLYLKIASFIFGVDREMHLKETDFFEKLVNLIKPSEADKKTIMYNLEKESFSTDLLKKVTKYRGDRKILIFAWQCVCRDGVISPSEEEAFNKIKNAMRISDEEVVKLKSKAETIMKLKDDQAFEVYFES